MAEVHDVGSAYARHQAETEDGHDPAQQVLYPHLYCEPHPPTIINHTHHVVCWLFFVPSGCMCEIDHQSNYFTTPRYLRKLDRATELSSPSLVLYRQAFLPQLLRRKPPNFSSQLRDKIWGGKVRVQDLLSLLPYSVPRDHSPLIPPLLPSPPLPSPPVWDHRSVQGSHAQPRQCKSHDCSLNHMTNHRFSHMTTAIYHMTSP